MFDWPYTFREIKEFTQEVLTPAVVILLPALAAVYYKINKILKGTKVSFRGYDARLRDWETNFSRNIIQSLGFFLDGVDSNPYCMTDQIMYIGIENGVVGPGRIHSMYVSVHAETSGVSRCSKKAQKVQRLPYTSIAAWCAELEAAGILRIPNLAESPFANLPIHDSAASALAVPVYTKEHWLTGIVVFNYFDPNFNSQPNVSKDEDLLDSIKVFIEGQILQMDLARAAWIKQQQ